MATDEDARTAARRIVEQVLADQAAPTDAADEPTRALEVIDDAVEEVTVELGVMHAEALVVDAVEAIAVERDVEVDAVRPGVAQGRDEPDDAEDAPEDEATTDGRARARALVAEVLAAHEAGHTGPGA
ncbi:MAG: hypothetical protein WEB09_00050, partial [Nitriliruptor sp.]